MEKALLTAQKEMTSAIELTVQDNQQRIKKAVLFFSIEDDWFSNDAAADVPGFFASALMKVVQRDSGAVLMQVQTYRIINGIKQKSLAYCPMIRHDVEFKNCIIANDGTMEFI